MEGAVVDAIVGSLVQNFISFLTSEFSLIRGVKNDVRKLISTLSTIQAVLEDAEEKQINNKPITKWLRDLKHATYDADDILNEWFFEIQQRDLEFTNTGCTYKATSSVSSCLCFKNMMFRRKTAKKIKEILSTFEGIAVQRSQFYLSMGVVLPNEPQFNKERETTSVINEPHIYGRDENKMKIIDILLHDFLNQENISICPIVGMGGLGKTTLAQSIYNHESIQRHFELKIWVCVSEPFDVERILKSIIESYDKKACDLVTLQSLYNKVEEILRGERYLIVLDDVWNENQDKWNQLKSFLKGGAKGSSLVLTTRSQNVAAITGTVPEHRLGALSDGDCFLLFKNRALGDRGDEEYPNLIAIGKEIAKKCKGVPLLAKSLGSMLRFKTDKKQWELVRDSEIWNLSEGGEDTVLAALRLSYNHLSSCLKQCFSYCSLFPKDYNMQRNHLIYLWITNGFIQSQGSMELEEVADEIFNELLGRSFFQDAKEDDYGNIKTCKMHDFMHDLACSVVIDESLIVKASEKNPVPKTIRNLTVVSGSPGSPIDLDHLLSSQPSLRTLSFAHSIDFDRFHFSSTLRVLDLGWRRIKTLPPSVFFLKHLRYLDLSQNLLTSLPDSFHMLGNLQMLDLNHNPQLTTLPLSICKLEQLRYLNLSYCEGIISLAHSFQGLKNLRSLNLSGNGKITALPLSICELESLMYLDLSSCGNITSLPESIDGLKNLRSLDLSGDGFLTALPPSIGNLEHLRYLNLSKCNEITSLPESVSGLRNLHSLILRKCKKINVLPANMRDMSSLRHLDISRCYGLTKMPVGIGQLRCLQTLTRFVAGRASDGDNGGGSAAISELQGLNNLKGVLAIEMLENVRNGEDAKKASLTTKSYLTSLQLIWGRCGVDDPLQVNNSSQVLESLLFLQLSPNLQELQICNYKWEACFPEVFVENLKGLIALKSVVINNCRKLRSLPRELVNLKSLRSLRISGCDELVALPEGLLQKPASIEILEIYHSRRLRSLGFIGIQGRVNPNTPSSSHLQSSLQKLDIFNCPELVFPEDDFQHLNALSHLILRSLPQLTAIPQGIQKLPAIQHLLISKCWNLRMLPEWIKRLTSLQSLEIKKCHQELHRRCKEKGKDWHLISDIPDLMVMGHV